MGQVPGISRDNKSKEIRASQEVAFPVENLLFLQGQQMTSDVLIANFMWNSPVLKNCSGGGKKGPIKLFDVKDNGVGDQGRIRVNTF